MIGKQSRSSWVVAGVCAAAIGAMMAAPSAYAADVMKEVAAAKQHAGLAAGSKEVKMVHAHLQHVINCLVGPKGKGFDAAQLNPCKDLGKGIIPDAKKASVKADAQAALEMAMSGLKVTDLTAAQMVAIEVGGKLN